MEIVTIKRVIVAVVVRDAAKVGLTVGEGGFGKEVKELVGRQNRTYTRSGIK